MSDSTKSDNIDQLDAGSARWQLKTHYNPNNDEHLISTISTEWEHQMIHEGNAFSLSGAITALGNGATMSLMARTPVSPATHWRAAHVVVEDAPVDIYFYEAPTTTADGTPLTAYNKNRGSVNTPSLLLFSSPTVTATGTELEYGYIPGATGGGGGSGGGRSSGGEAERAGGEWILASDTDYLVQITNNSGGAVDIGYTFFWYEL